MKNDFEKKSKQLLFSNILTSCVRKHINTFRQVKIIFNLELIATFDLNNELCNLP